MKIILRFFFKLLYHQFAFAYDLVAATVSLGRWKDWVSSILPFIEGTRILELGSGPGHLQRLLLTRGLVAVAIDESAPMTRLARRNILRRHFDDQNISSINPEAKPAYTQINLTRGLAQHLPFCDRSFDSIVATFPTEYITAHQTLLEVRRCLSDGGRFIVLPGAVITSHRIWDRFMAWVFRITGQTPPNLSEIIHERSKEPFAKAGFQLEIRELDVQSSTVFLMIATKDKHVEIFS